MTYNNLVDAIIARARETKDPNKIQQAHDCVVRVDIKQMIRDFIFQFIDRKL